MTDPSMHWKQFILITRELPVWIVTAAVLISTAGSADRQRKALVLRDGRIEFSPNRRAFWAWPLLVVYLVYATISQLKGSHGRPLDLIIAAGLGILAMMFLFTFPETIIGIGQRPGADFLALEEEADSLGRHRKRSILEKRVVP